MNGYSNLILLLPDRSWGLRYCPKCTSGSNIFTRNDSAQTSYRQQVKVQIMTLLSSNCLYLCRLYFKNLPKNENCRNNNNHNNNNSDNPLTSGRTDECKQKDGAAIFRYVTNEGAGQCSYVYSSRAGNAAFNCRHTYFCQKFKKSAINLL